MQAIIVCCEINIGLFRMTRESEKGKEMETVR